MTKQATFEDGIYFDMPEDIYHAIPRLSSSGIQNLIVSPATFWAKSWLNPAKAELLASCAMREVKTDPDALGLAQTVAAMLFDWHDSKIKILLDSDEGEEATKAQQLGKAYHCARLQPELLESRFARQPERADFPSCKVWTGTDIERELQLLEQPKTKAGETVAEKGARLEAAGFDEDIFPLEMERWKEKLGSRTPIAAGFWDDMLVDIERIHRQKEVAALLADGVAEVAVLWTGPGGIPMKAKIDYLKTDSWSDLKTFDNSRGKHLFQALVDGFRFNRQHVQAAVYREAVEAIRVGGLQIVGTANDQQRKVIASIQLRPDELKCWFIYQEKGGIPNVLARSPKFFDVPLNIKAQHAGASDEGIAAVEEATRTEQLWFRRALFEVERGRRDFLDYQDIYQRGQPWQPIHALGEFSDADFHPSWLDNREMTI